MTNCIHCRCELERKDVTIDHIPPACIFPDKKKAKGIIEAPSCRNCNQQMSLDDELFKGIATDYAARDNPSAAVVSASFMRSLDKPGKAKFRDKFLDLLKPVELVSESGLWLENSYKWKMNKARLLNVIKKIARGLYWHCKDKPVPDGYQIAALCLTDAKTEQIANLSGVLPELYGHQTHLIGDRVFEYKLGFNEGNESAAFLMRFYEWLEFVAVVAQTGLFEAVQGTDRKTAETAQVG